MSFNTNPGYVDYIANNSQVRFIFTFKIYYDSDLVVWHKPVNSAPELPADKLTLGQDYDVNIADDLGGSIDLLFSTVQGDKIVIERNLDIDRLIEYQTHGDLLAGTLNTDQDYQTYLIMDVNDEQRKFFKAPEGIAGFDGTMPPPIPYAYIRWNKRGDGFENDTQPPAWRDETYQFYQDAEKEKWYAEAWKKTANSIANQGYNEHTRLYSSNGDGTFGYTETNEFSSYHWSLDASQYSLPKPTFPDQDGYRLTARVNGNAWEEDTALSTSYDGTGTGNKQDNVQDAVNTIDAKLYNDVPESSYVLHDGRSLTIKDNRHQWLHVGMPIGTIFDFGGSSHPTGSLPCDGREVAIADYPELYGAIGTLWNNTAGQPNPASGNFRVPIQTTNDTDTFGLYTRGTDGVSPVVGAYQNDTNLEHQHSGGAHTHTMTHDHNVTVDNGGAHDHNVYLHVGPGSKVYENCLQNMQTDYNETYKAVTNGEHSHNISMDVYAGSTGQAGDNPTSYSGENENRPHSITVLKCIWAGK